MAGIRLVGQPQHGHIELDTRCRRSRHRHRRRARNFDRNYTVGKNHAHKGDLQDNLGRLRIVALRTVPMKRSGPYNSRPALQARCHLHTQVAPARRPMADHRHYREDRLRRTVHRYLHRYIHSLHRQVGHNHRLRDFHRLRQQAHIQPRNGQHNQQRPQRDWLHMRSGNLVHRNHKRALSVGGNWLDALSIGQSGLDGHILRLHRNHKIDRQHTLVPAGRHRRYPQPDRRLQRRYNFL